MKKTLILLAGLLTAFAGMSADVVKTFENEQVTVQLGKLGEVLSVKEKSSGRELTCGNTGVPIYLKRKGQKVVGPARFKAEGNRLTWGFAAPVTGEFSLEVSTFDGGWIMKIVKCDIADMEWMQFARVRAADELKWFGFHANMRSDEKSFICLRGCDYAMRMAQNREGGLYVQLVPGHNPIGMRVAFAAGPRASALKQLQAMTLAAGVPHSEAGGPWAMNSPNAKSSYLFADLRNHSVDDWIALAEKCGTKTIHLCGWWGCLGHYPVSKGMFPGGEKEMKEACDKIHAAGLKVGIHTLTACINPADTWITPICETNLMSWAKYTLAKPLNEGDKEIFVNEPLSKKHDVVFTYSGNGNALRIGTEVIQYTGLRETAPYGFTGIQRGAFRTKRGGPYPAGTEVSYLQQRYIAFYPEPDSKLADDLAECIAKTYHECNLDQVYNDGAEGMMTPYGVDALRTKIIGACARGGRSVVNEDSNGCAPFSWWYHSRIGAFDHPLFAPKRFVDLHVASLRHIRNNDMLGTQMGWWAPRGADAFARGHFEDEMEYFACKVAGIDSAMSLQGVGVADGPLPFGIDCQVTILGWWEHARTAGAFSEDWRKRFDVPGDEYRLRQCPKDGIWRVAPIDCMMHRVGDPSRAMWFVKSKETRPAELRVEALYTAARPEEEKDVRHFLTTADLKDMKKTYSRGGIDGTVTAVQDKEHGACFRLEAKNTQQKTADAWMATELKIARPYRKVQRSCGVWVKGDGSGALLEIRFNTPREYTPSITEQFVRLDFTGWKYVEFMTRERDMDEYKKHILPRGSDIYAHYRYHFKPDALSGVMLTLAEIPAGKTAAVEVSEIRAFETIRMTMKDVCVTVDGRDFKVPFDMTSGDYAVLANGYWTLRNEKGLPLKRAKTTDTLTLTEGTAAVRFTATGDGKHTPRAEVTTFGIGAWQEVYAREMPTEVAAKMKYEAMLPMWYAPTKGYDTILSIAVRPNCEAALDITIEGPVSKPTFSWKTLFGWKTESRTFPVDIAKKQRLVCPDGLHWKVLDRARKTVAEGTLPEAFPTFSGVTEMSLSSADDTAADARINLVKRYR